MVKKSKNKKKHSRLKKAVGSIVVLAVVVVAGYFLFFHHEAPKTISVTETSSEQYSTPGTSANADNNDRKSNPSSAAQTLDNGPTVTSPTSSPTISVTVNRAQNTGSDLQVGTLISGATTGTCVLSVSQAGQTTVTATDSVTLQTNSYVCPVFNVPLSSFPSSGQGDWNVSVTLTSGGSTTTGQWGGPSVQLPNSN